MKKLLLALLLIPALAGAQDFKHRYFHYNQYFDAAAPFTILANTVDGADNNIIQIASGGAIGSTRGAGLYLYGNEAANTGALYLEAGNVVNSEIMMSTGANRRITIPYLADADDADIILGKTTTTSPAFSIHAQTADGDDDGSLSITPGGAVSASRGAYIYLYGNENGTANGGVDITAGTNASYGAVSLSTNGNVKLTIPYLADADDSDVVLGKANPTAPIFTIRGQTADADDDGVIKINPGGAAGATRGAQISLEGNDVGGADAGGDVKIYGGNAATGGLIEFYTGAAALRWTIEADGDFAQDATSGGLITFNNAVGKAILPKSGDDLPDAPVEGSLWLDTNDSTCTDANADADDVALCFYMDAEWILLGGNDNP